MKRSPRRFAAMCALLASVAVGASACGGGKASAKDPAAPAATSTATASRSGPHQAPEQALVNLFQDLAAKVKATPDCDRFGALLDAWVTREHAEVKALVAQVENKASSMSQPDVDDLKAHLTDAFQVVISRANQCKDSPAAKTAFHAFDQMIQGT